MRCGVGVECGIWEVDGKWSRFDELIRFSVCLFVENQDMSFERRFKEKEGKVDGLE